MSVVSNINHSAKQKNKVILSATCIGTIGVIVLFTIFGLQRCKNVDKISNSLIFKYNEDVSVNTLDPAFIKSQSEIWLGTQIYEGLVGLDSNLRPIPKLCKSWEISPDGRVYKFVLKSNVQFSWVDVNGFGKKTIKFKPVKSNDLAYSFYRIIDPKTASPGAWIFNDKVNIPLKNNKNSKSPLPLYKSSENPFYCPNDSTIIITLNKPFPAFLSLLATNYAWVMPEFTQNWTNQQRAAQPIGTGPFYLRIWETEVRLVLRKNPQYHEFENNKRLPYLEAINVGFVKNKQTAFMQFMAGKYDFFNGMDGTFKDELLSKEGTLNPAYKNKINALVSDFLNTEYIGFNLNDSLNGKENPLKDKNLRKALQFSIDRLTLLKYFRNGLGTEGKGGFVPPTMLNSKDEKSYFVKDSAIWYWKKSNLFRNPSKFVPLKLTVISDYLDMAIFLQKAWNEIGIKIEIDIQTAGMSRQLRNEGKLGLFRGSWIADYPDAENYLSCFYSGYFSPNGPNYTHFYNKQFDDLFNELAFGVFDTPKKQSNRLKLIEKANQIIATEAPIVVLYYDKSLRLMQKNVKGLGNDAINRLDLKRVRN